MSRTVGNLVDDVAGLLQATNLNDVTNLFGAFQRALSVMKQRAYVPEASARQSIMLYNGVFDYPAPTNIFGSTLRDIRPQGVSRNSWDYVYKQPIEQFDRTKCLLPNGYQVTFEFDRLLNPIMRVSDARTPQAITLDPMNSTTGWATGGTASGLVIDSTVFYQSPASLRFNLTGSGTGYIEKTFSPSMDLTSYQGVGVNFLAIYCPTAANLSSIEIRLGSDSSNYYSLTKTQGFIGAWISGDFLLVAFDLALAATTGTPVITAMKYVRLTFTTTGTITNMRTGSLFLALPSAHEVLYGSTAVFNSAGTLSGTITNNNDQIMLADPAYNIYQHECAVTVALQNGGTFSNGVISALTTILFGTRTRTGQVVQLGLYDLYRADNPSEELKSTGNWYDD